MDESSSKRRRFTAEDYTVGWVCALDVELAAARRILDDTHEDLPHDTSDTNVYTLGRIGFHNVVIVCLPAGRMGTTSAATVASQMSKRFKGIRFGLMVGIGGGVPSPISDVRLGDVVVSLPSERNGGVVQYDYGKTEVNGESTITGFLNAPPQLLLKAITKLRSNHRLEQSGIPTHLAPFHDLPEFKRDSAGPDILYPATYQHEGGPSCDHCQKGMSIDRDVRDKDIVIHYGTIASGNQVMKDGKTRDELSAKLGNVLCFEMEAAGLMNDFPCLVIRGVCDYADSHKNKTWQPYASATAAAYAKDLLSVIAATEVIDEVSATQIVGHQPSQRPEMSPEQRQTLLESRKTIVKSLRYDQIESRHTSIKNPHGRTCRWLLDRAEYRDWHDPNKLCQHHGFMWIKGKPGSGKSTIMKYACAHATSPNAQEAVIISMFFNARGNSLEKSVEGMYRSLLLQIFEKFEDSQAVLDTLKVTHSRDGTISWEREKLADLFRLTIESLGKRNVVCFIDALDECDEDQVREMIAYFEDLGDVTTSVYKNFRVCFSSRHFPYITIRHGIQLTLEGQEGHEQDMTNYIHSKLNAGRSAQVDQIKSEISRRAKGVFLWVVLVVQILNKEYDRGRMQALRKRLTEIPDGLDKLFEEILTRDRQNMTELVVCCQWILYAERPLKVAELYFGILSGAEPQDLSAWDPEIISTSSMGRRILDASKGLVETTKTKDSTVQFIHESVRDFFLSGSGAKWFQDGQQSNCKGHSHNKLKIYCQNYIEVVPNVFFDKPLSPAKSPEAAELRAEISRWYPLLEYSVNYIMAHADMAESHEVDQRCFLEEFPLQRWVYLNNVFERFNTRRFNASTRLLYILAERNLPHLIRLGLMDIGYTEIESRDRYKFPIYAALAAKNLDAVKALLYPAYETVRAAHKTDHSGAAKPNPQHLEEILHFLLEYSKSRLPFGRPLSADLVVNVSLPKLSGPAVEIMLRYTTRVSPASQNAHSMLQIAESYGLGTFVEELILKYGAGVDIETTDETALSHAVFHGHEHIVEQLIRHGADVNLRSFQGGDYPFPMGRSYFLISQTFNLCPAALKVHHSIVHMLSCWGANVNASFDHVGSDPTAFQDFSALYATAAKSHISVVDKLIRSGTDVDQVVQAFRHRPSGPIYIAALHNVFLVDKLLLSGADMDSFGVYDYWCTVLWTAAANGHASMVDLLIRGGADVNKRSGFDFYGQGSSALDVAVLGTHFFVVNQLLCNGASANDLSAPFRTSSAIYAAIKQSNTSIIKQLLRHGAYVDWNGNDNNVLSIALLYDDQPTLELLLRHGGSEITAATKSRLLHEKYLLLAGIDSDQFDGWHKGLKLLLDHGAEPNFPQGESGKDYLDQYDLYEAAHREFSPNHGTESHAPQEDPWKEFHTAFQPAQKYADRRDAEPNSLRGEIGEQDVNLYDSWHREDREVWPEHGAEPFAPRDDVWKDHDTPLQPAQKSPDENAAEPTLPYSFIAISSDDEEGDDCGPPGQDYDTTLQPAQKCADKSDAEPTASCIIIESSSDDEEGDEG